MDGTDRQILTILQDGGRTTNAEIARQVGMAPSAVLERIRKLEDRKVIEGYAARLDPIAVGCGLLAFVYVRTEQCSWEPEAGRALANMPGVQEVHHIAGEDCFLVKVRTRDTEELGRLLRDDVGGLKSVIATRTTIVLNIVKESMTIPICECEEKGRNGRS